MNNDDIFGMSNSTNAPQGVTNIGVINPFALAELVTNQSIDWDTVDERRVFEESFDRPYEELFDPQYGSPLYPGVELTAEGSLERRSLRDLDLAIEDNAPRSDPDLSNVSNLGDLGESMSVGDASELEVRNARVNTSDSVSLEVRRPQAERAVSALQPFSRDVIEAIMAAAETDEEWTPSGAAWNDPGDFFSETAEWFDPMQGAVANCYFIAALSAVAWAKPYQITHRTRATGETQQAFVDMVEFHGGGSSSRVEVSEAVPLRNGNWIYARSREQDEIWPAVYEKAYAKWKTGVSSDKPDITQTAFGDPVRAVDELVGGSRSYTGTSNNTADDLWSEVRGNSRSYKTFNPGCAWTYSSGSSAPNNISYNSANIVANHAYAVLGWDYDQGTKYIALYNPWGRTEASTGRMNGVWTPYDESFWRRVNMPDNDGTFAVDAPTFKRYFAGLGFVS